MKEGNLMLKKTMGILLISTVLVACSNEEKHESQNAIETSTEANQNTEKVQSEFGNTIDEATTSAIFEEIEYSVKDVEVMESFVNVSGKTITSTNNQILVVVTYNLKNVGSEGVSPGLIELTYGSPRLVTKEGQALKSNFEFTSNYETAFGDENYIIHNGYNISYLNPGTSIIQYEVYEVDRNFWEENEFLFANSGIHKAQEYSVYFTR